MQKKMRTARGMTSPKIVIVGGSAPFFGMSARELADRTGLSAVNLATHGGNGLRYTLYIAEQAASPGDVVVLPLEYNHYQSVQLAQHAAEASYMDGMAYFLDLPIRQKARYLRFISIGRMLQGLETKFVSPFTPPTKGYWGLRVDDVGDVPTITATPASKKAIDDLVRAGKTPRWPMPLEFSASAFDYIGAFHRRMAARNIRVFVTAPPILQDLAPFADEMRHIRNELDRVGAEYLTLADDNRLAADVMYDTRYHPTFAGRRISTQRLGDSLCAALRDGGGATCRN